MVFLPFISDKDTMDSRERTEIATQPEVDIQTQGDNIQTDENIVFLDASSSTVFYTLYVRTNGVLQNGNYIRVRRPECNSRVGEEEEEGSQTHAASPCREGKRAAIKIPMDLCK
eukprot:gb/GECG01002936.1/.p1 GENE.gb/GECG01002936.1/~~gb/GECG01002936.1/.p1  ORF type:complete len:114 (+),score=9.47 gb/GECG01002936.1/:1-342(+)